MIDPAELAALRIKNVEQGALLDAADRTEWELREEIRKLQVENEQQARHLRVWQQGFRETAAATQGELAGLRAPADPAKRLLSDILAVVNRHQGANAEQAMAEIHEACAALLDSAPAAPLPTDCQ